MVARCTGAAEERTSVIEITLVDEDYCLDIRSIEGIIKGEYTTRVPKTPEVVEGVVDRCGQITTIVNPKGPIGTDDTEPGDLIDVFDGEAVAE
ncbi:MAG: chemotaxis protein CheW [Haloarculaceae archaeon]